MHHVLIGVCKKPRKPTIYKQYWTQASPCSMLISCSLSPLDECRLNRMSSESNHRGYLLDVDKVVCLGVTWTIPPRSTVAVCGYSSDSI